MFILRRRFFISWLASSLLMFGLSYIWHGVITTDLQKISYPLQIFLISAGIVYFVLGFLLTRIYQSKTLSRYFIKQPFIKGIVTGSALGFVLFLITLVLGISFNQSLNLEFFLIDLGWQMIEQMTGGLVVALVHIFIWDPAPLPEELDH
ncbi:MAG: hypothetical protein IT233_09640 [Bacteroidia bacterium]|nr:hypothetical protein [Bacteroidia bacterium]